MKYFALLFCAVFLLALAQPVIPAVPAANGPLETTPTQMLPTLAQDLKELKSLMQLKELKSLINLYLLKDAEFQGFIRELNSHEAYIAFMKLRMQPEIMAFTKWVQNEIKRSGVVNSTEEGCVDLEIINHSGRAVYGWQGFITEFQFLYPVYTIRDNIQLKQQQGGIFAEFWQRVRDLRVVFDRFLLFFETQELIALLQEHNIDVLHLENFIRTQFDWIVVVPTAPRAVVAPVLKVI